MTTLTDREIQAKKANGKDQWFSDETGSRGTGRLVLRVTPTGTKVFYFRITNAEGKREQIRLGSYGATDQGITLKEARRLASEHSLRYQAGEKDLKAILTHEQEQLDLDRQRQAQAAADAAAQASAGTLQTLMDLYARHLEAKGKQSAKDVKYLFAAHVTGAFPVLASSQAKTVSSQEFREVLAKLTEAGKGRTAGKLRSYLKAAYAMAMRAEFDPTAPAGFLDMRIETNPLDRLPALSQFNIARERALSWPELHAYVRHVEALPESGTKDLLLLSLLLGGQRPEQLGRLMPADVDLDGGMVSLYDPKGKRQQARQHVLPLSDRGKAIVTRRIEYAKGGWLFSSTHGRVKIRPQTLTAAVVKIAAVMLAQGAARADFQMRDIRRTCETLLAGMGVNKDLRAQLQSHGLGGVQQRHYDKHDYMEEKRRALKAWEERLFQVEAPANVLQIARSA